MNLELERRQPSPGWQFYGDDWTELGQVFGILCDHDDAPTCGFIREAIAKLQSRIRVAQDKEGRARPGDMQQVEACRRFLRAVIVQSLARRDYETPLWFGLAEIRDDWTFLRYLSALLEHLWT